MPDFDIHKLLHLQVQKASSDRTQAALLALLTPYFRPTFGAGKTVEHEVSVLRALELLGVVPARATELDLVMTLRVTRAKARALLYQVQLADVHNLAALDDHVREVLAHPRLGQLGSRDGGPVVWLLDVPFPFVADRIRQLVRQEGFISDSSFSPTLIKLSSNAYGAVVASLIPLPERDALLAVDPASSSAPWRVYNIGCSNPVNLLDYIAALESSIGLKAHMQLLPIFDLLKTGGKTLLNRLSR